MIEIILSQGKVSPVPDAVAEFLNRDKWCAFKNGNNYYACRHPKKHERIDGKDRKIYMHRVIWEYFNGPIPEGEEIDHIDGNGLNNFENLRCCSHKDNCKNCRKSKRNTSKYPGVCWRKDAEKWTSRIRVDGKQIYLYWGDSKEEAIAARKAGEIKHFGEFARKEEEVIWKAE